jgi:AcrR family transcriptional regulator
MMRPAASEPMPARRARPLPRAKRRAALIAATLPLVREHGVEVSTRQIAAAAGIAEGTIFRVFPDKNSLLQATLEAAFDPAPVVAALERIDMALPLAERLIAVARIVQAWLTTVIILLMALRGGRHGRSPHPRRKHSSDVIAAAITRVIEPDRGLLTVPPAQAARLLRLLLFSGSHPGIAEGRLLTPEEIVTVILDGVRARDQARTGGQAPC